MNEGRYDLRGRLVASIENGTRTTTYGYDDRDNLVGITDPEMGGEMTATDDQILTERLPGDVVATFGYDETCRDQSLRWEKAAGCSPL